MVTLTTRDISAAAKNPESGPAHSRRLPPGVVAALALVASLAATASAQTDVRLAEAAMKRDMTAVRALVEQKVDVNAPGKDGTPALHWIVRVDDLETAKLLLRAGADAERGRSLRRHPAVARVLERQRGHDGAAARCRRRCERVGSRGRNDADDGGARRRRRRREAAARPRRRRGREGSRVSADGADGRRARKPSRRSCSC